MKILEELTFYGAFVAISMGTAGVALSNTSEFCSVLGDTSAKIMLARQGGMPMSKMMGIANGLSDDPETKILMTEIIVAAYDVPRYSVEENMTEAVIDFRNDVELECYKAAK